METSDHNELNRIRPYTLIPGMIIVYMYSTLSYNVVAYLARLDVRQSIQFVVMVIFLGHCLGHAAVNLFSNLTKYRLICAMRYIVVVVLIKGTVEVFTREANDPNVGNTMCPLLLVNLAFYVLKRSEQQVIADQADWEDEENEKEDEEDHHQDHD